MFSLLKNKFTLKKTACRKLQLVYFAFLLVEADAEAKSTGRADEDNNPSVVVQALTRLISEFADVFKSGLSSLFRNAKESEDSEEETDEESNTDEASQNRRSGGNQVEGKLN